MIFTEYVTLGGERWDTIANKAYGSPGKITPIIQANPGMPLFAIFAQGITLLVPVITVTVETDPSLLPPWKRGLSIGAQQAASAAPILNDIRTSPAGSFDGSFD